MKKYKLTRKEIIECMEDYGVLDWNPDIYAILVNSLLATEPESDKESKCRECKTTCSSVCECQCHKVKGAKSCNYCSSKHNSQEELEVEPIKRLKSYKDKKGNIWIKDTGARKKLNSLIKAHNALVKEVKGL